MKTMLVKDKTHDRKTKLNAQKTYQTTFGNWVAEVDGTELRRACDILCRGIKDCKCDNLHIEADLDDDGKEYKLKKTH